MPFTRQYLRGKKSVDHVEMREGLERGSPEILALPLSWDVVQRRVESSPASPGGSSTPSS